MRDSFEPRSNYFIVNRSLLQSDRWLTEPFTRGQAWVDMFGLANHRDGYIRVRGHRVDVKRGQLAYSQDRLARRWQWSRGKIKRFLNELEKEADIVQQTDSKITLITICKYNFWQGEKLKNSTADSTADSTGTKNDNKNKEIIYIYSQFISKFGKNEKTYKLTNQRKQKISARLEDAGKDMLLRAIDKTSRSSFHRCDNDRGWCADLDFIVRSYEQVEKLANMEARRPGEEAVDLKIPAYAKGLK